jgi:hypothetical protein
MRATRPAEFVFFGDGECEIYGPHVIGDGFTDPDSARMVEMHWAKSLLVGALALRCGFHMGGDAEKLMGCCHLSGRAILEKIRIGGSPMSRVEHLACL